jgi:hypothetical protein
MEPTMPLMTRPECTPTRTRTQPPSGFWTAAAAASSSRANSTISLAWLSLSTSRPVHAM